MMFSSLFGWHWNTTLEVCIYPFIKEMPLLTPIDSFSVTILKTSIMACKVGKLTISGRDKIPSWLSYKTINSKGVDHHELFNLQHLLDKDSIVVYFRDNIERSDKLLMLFLRFKYSVLSQSPKSSVFGICLLEHLNVHSLSNVY